MHVVLEVHTIKVFLAGILVFLYIVRRPFFVKEMMALLLCVSYNIHNEKHLSGFFFKSFLKVDC